MQDSVKSYHHLGLVLHKDMQVGDFAKVTSIKSTYVCSTCFLSPKLQGHSLQKAASLVVQNNPKAYKRLPA